MLLFVILGDVWQYWEVPYSFMNTCPLVCAFLNMMQKRNILYCMTNDAYSCAPSLWDGSRSFNLDTLFTRTNMTASFKFWTWFSVLNSKELKVENQGAFQLETKFWSQNEKVTRLKIGKYYLIRTRKLQKLDFELRL